MRLASWASIAGLTTLLVGSAEAMPTLAPYHADSEITLAADGCGYYWHRNVYGACVPNGPGWGGGVVAPGYYGYGAPGYWHGGYYHGGVSYHYRYHTSYHTGGWHGGHRHGGGGHRHGGGGHRR